MYKYSVRERYFLLGISVGVIIVTTMFYLTVYQSIINQRDYWRAAYCQATDFELDFCDQFERLTLPPELL